MNFRFHRRLKGQRNYLLWECNKCKQRIVYYKWIVNMNPQGRWNFETIPFQLSLESADSSIKFWSPLNFFFLWFASLSFRLVLLHVFPYNFVKHNLELKMSSFFPLFTKYSSQSWQYTSLEHHLRIVAMHFERSYQELWRKHVEIKRPKDGVLYDQFPFNHDVTKETVILRNKTCFILFLFNLIFLTNKVVQGWIKLIDLESRAKIKLIVIFFRSESMNFFF